MTLHFLYHRDQIPQLPDKKKKKTKQTQNFKVSVIFSSKFHFFMGSKRWRSGETPMWPGFKSRRRRHMWVEFVVGSLLCSERFFSRYSGFPLSSKTNISKFHFDQESGRRRTTLWMCYLQIIIYLFIPIPCSAAHTPLGRIRECLPSLGNYPSGQFRAVLMSIWVYKTS